MLLTWLGLNWKLPSAFSPVHFLLPSAAQSLSHAYLVRGQPEPWAEFTYDWSSLSLAFSLVALNVRIPAWLYFLVLQARDMQTGSSPHTNPLIHVSAALLTNSGFVHPPELSNGCYTLSRVVWEGPALLSQRSTSLMHSSPSLPPLTHSLLPCYLALFLVFPFFGVSWKLSITSLCYLLLSFSTPSFLCPTTCSPLTPLAR